jgi:hypothetical protein
MASTGALTIDGTTVPVATLVRIDGSGSIATIGAVLAAVPFELSLTDTGAGVTLLDRVTTFSETLQVVWSGEVAARVGASATGHIAYFSRSGLDPGVIHVRTLDGSPLWTTNIAQDVYIYDPEIHLTTSDDVTLLEGSRYLYNSSGFVQRIAVPFSERARLQTDGSVLGSRYEKQTEIGRMDANGTVLWTTNVRSVVTSAVLAADGDVLVVREPGTVVRLDGAGRELASHENCASEDAPLAPFGLGLLYADATGYILHDARGIARYEGP